MKELTDQEILKHKDFDSLFRSYRMIRKPLVQKPWFIATSAAIAACLIITLYFSFLQNSSILNNQNYSHNATTIQFNPNDLPKTIKPPFASLNIPVERFQVNADHGGTFKSASGSTLNIPAKAFIDEEGNALSGNIEVSYREFQNPLDFFLSGIPMHQNLNGKPIQASSAGMFEILAFQESQPVFLDKSSQIQIEQISYFPGECDRLFYDEASGQWMNQGMNELVSENGQVVESKEIMTFTSDSIGIPVLPRKANKGKNIFNIQVDVSGFPELAAYKGLLFEVNESHQKFDVGLYDVKWEKASLNTSNISGNYDLTLMIRDSAITLLVYPVFNNKNYQEAMKVYQGKKQEWLANTQHQKLKQQQANQHKESQHVILDGVSENPAIVDYSALKSLGKRHFAISKLGIYQSAMPYTASAMQVLQPRVATLDGKELKNLHMFIADRRHNILYNFGTSPSIAFEKSASNLFWFVTKQGQMGIVTPEAFVALTESQERPLIKVQLMEPAKAIGILRETMQI